MEYIKSMQEVFSRESLEEAQLINDVLKEAVETENAFKENMHDSIISYASQSMDEAREALEDDFDQALGTLAEEASSDLVQQELAAIGQAINTRLTRLSDSLQEIAGEFDGVEIGRDTPKDVLNDLLSRYPPTEEVKG